MTNTPKQIIIIKKREGRNELAEGLPNYFVLVIADYRLAGRSGFVGHYSKRVASNAFLVSN